MAAGLAKNPAIASFSTGTVAELQVNNFPRRRVAMDAVQGHVTPALLEGRAPNGLNDIVLGTKTLDAVHAHIGGHVSVRVGAEVRTFRVVGRGVFPNIGDSGQLGRGAFVTHAALCRSAPDAPRNIVFDPLGTRRRPRGGPREASHRSRSLPRNVGDHSPTTS